MPYDVAARFKEVARRAEESKKKNAGSIFGAKKKESEPMESVESLRSSFRKQYPSSGGSKGDVNLPNEQRKKQGLGPSFMR